MCTSFEQYGGLFQEIALILSQNGAFTHIEK